MSNIEEDVKTIKYRVDKCREEFEDFGEISFAYSDLDRIENILSEREADKKRIKELEEERQLVGMPVKNKRDGRIGVVLHQWESGSVAVLENINPRIINTHDNWSTLEILTDEVKQTQIKCDSIPVQKVKDLIENETINISGFECIAVEDLEELLEEK